MELGIIKIELGKCIVPGGKHRPLDGSVALQIGGIFVGVFAGVSVRLVAAQGLNHQRLILFVQFPDSGSLLCQTLHILHDLFYKGFAARLFRSQLQLFGIDILYILPHIADGFCQGQIRIQNGQTHSVLLKIHTLDPAAPPIHIHLHANRNILCRCAGGDYLILSGIIQPDKHQVNPVSQQFFLTRLPAFSIAGYGNRAHAGNIPHEHITV